MQKLKDQLSEGGTKPEILDKVKKNYKGFENYIQLLETNFDKQKPAQVWKSPLLIMLGSWRKSSFVQGRNIAYHYNKTSQRYFQFKISIFFRVSTSNVAALRNHRSTTTYPDWIGVSLFARRTSFSPRRTSSWQIMYVSFAIWNHEYNLHFSTRIKMLFSLNLSFTVLLLYYIHIEASQAFPGVAIQKTRMTSPRFFL